MKKTWLRRVGLAGALLASLAMPAVAAPAMWVVRDADSTLHLFGTVHLLRPDTVWRTPEMNTAFAAAQEVWLELDPEEAEDPAILQRLLPLMTEPGPPLKQRLTAEQYARYVQIAESVGIWPGQYDGLRPAFTAMFLTITAMTRMGYRPYSGVEDTLRREMGPRPLRTLESMEQQMRFFADLPDQAQTDLLLSTLDQIGDPDFLNRMVQAWTDGDTAKLEEIYLAEMRRDHPQAYEVFVKVRNEAWAEAIAAEMEKAGTDFVAVGALHLVGPDGVPALLKARGYKVERVDQVSASGNDQGSSGR